MAWTTPRTWVAGELVTAAIGNTHWRDNLSLLKTSISNDGLTWTGAWAPAGGTVTVSTPILDATQTWNNAAVAFTLLRVNVTSTASAAASLFADFQLAGVSKFSVRKDGIVLVNATNVAGQSTALVHIAGDSTALYSALRIGNSWLVGRGSSTETYLASNTDLFTATTTGASSYYSQGAGVHSWYTAPSQTAGAAAAFVHRMTLTDNGRFGVGGNGESPAPDHPFHFRCSVSSWSMYLQNNGADPYGLTIYYGAAAPGASSNNYYLRCVDTGAVRLYIKGDGGISNYSANNVNLSDLGAKEIDGPAPSMRSRIRQIKLYSGRYKNPGRSVADVMWGAQDIAAFAPEWVDVWQEEERDAAGAILRPRLLGTRDHLIFLATVGVVAEHDAMLDDHAARIKRLEERGRAA